MKISSILPSLASKNLNRLGDENDEPIYTQAGPSMKKFERTSTKGGWCNSSIQPYESEISQEIFNIISQELGI